jgi:hypothetical protein
MAASKTPRKPRASKTTKAKAPKPEAEIIAHPRADLHLMDSDIWLRTMVEPAIFKSGSQNCFVAWEDNNGQFHCAIQNAGTDTLLIISSLVRRIAEGDLEHPGFSA